MKTLTNKMLVLFLILSLIMSITPVIAETTADTGIWENRAYVDDFGDPTDEYYYTAKMSGSFSNSATTDSEATATIIIDQSNEDSSVALIIYEYGNQQVKNPYSSAQEYEIKIKDSYGTVHTYSGYMYSDRLYIYDSEYCSWSPVEDIFARGGRIQFAIHPVDNKLTKYSFTIEDATGYANLFPITSVGEFSEGLAYYKRHNRYYGFMNTDGTEVLPCRYVSSNSFRQGLAYTKLAESQPNYGYIDKTGNIAFTVNTNVITSFTEDGVAYLHNPAQAINSEGNPISELKGRYFSEGLAPVEDNDLWGYIDLDGNLIIPCQYTNVSYFNDGLAMVKKADDDWNCIDTKGNVLFSFDCVGSNGFSEDLAMVWVGEKDNPLAGYIDKNGSLVIPAIYKNALVFSNGRAPVANGEKWGVIDKLGNTIVDFNIAGIIGTFAEGMLAVQNENRKWGFIDVDGTQTVPFEYEQVQNFTDGLA